MPNRVIKESAFLSERISELSDFEFRLWVGLITQADDAGRGDARPAIIKGRVFALRDRTTLKDIEVALRNLAAVGCVSLYTVGGKPYFQFPNWAKHQRVRDAKPKYPGIDECDFGGESPQPAANGGEELHTRARLRIQSNPIQSESNNSAEPQAPSVLTLTLNDGSEYPISQSDVDEWQAAFPNVDVMQQLQAMKLWCKDNAKKRKTKNGIRRFVTNWLDREQNRGGYRPQQQSVPQRSSPPPEASSYRREPTAEEMAELRRKMGYEA
jgi:hypothetical protein